MKRRLEIELYGRLRDAGFGDRVQVELPEGASAGQALEALRPILGESLQGCVVATPEAVLSADEPIGETPTLSVLPPVCGG